MLKKRGAFPTDEAILKVLYLGMQQMAKKWMRPIAEWKRALNQVAIWLGDQIPPTDSCTLRYIVILTGPLQAPTLLADLSDIGAILGDKAYNAQTVLEAIEACGAQAVIPPQASRLIQRDDDTYLYRARADIECFVQRLKQFRRLATRYDKLAQHFQAFLALAATMIWLL